MAGRCIDHATILKNRMFELIDTDTCDVTFVVGPGVRNDRISHSAIVPHSLLGDASCKEGSPEDTSTIQSTSLITNSFESSSTSLIISTYPGDNCASEAAATGHVEAPGDCRNQPNHTRATPTPHEPRLEPCNDDGRTCRRSGSMRIDHSEDMEGEKIEMISTGVVAANMNTALEIREAAFGRYSSDDHRGETATGVQEFRCHRVLFASCSEYFRVLLFGQMSESKSRRVELPDVSPDRFRDIIIYVYTGKVIVTTDNVMEVFSLAHRFAMSELQRACTEVLDECMNCNDVCRVLEAAEYYGQPELASKCWDLIKENTPRVLKSDGFLELSGHVMELLVQDGELQVCEADLFMALRAWIEHDPHDRRMRVDKLSPHFRLPLISLRDLMSIVRPSKLVPAEALLDAVTYHSDPDQWSGDPVMIRPRGKMFAWDIPSQATGAWGADEGRTVTTSLADWVGVYGNTVMRAGFHRWSVRASKLGHPDKKSSWKAVLGVARQRSQDLARPFLPITGFVVGTGQRKLGGNTAVDDYASVSVRDGDRVTVVYDADAGALTFLVNGMSLGEAYRGLSGPVVAALAINSAGAMWSLDCNG